MSDRALFCCRGSSAPHPFPLSLIFLPAPALRQSTIPLNVNNRCAPLRVPGRTKGDTGMRPGFGRLAGRGLVAAVGLVLTMSASAGDPPSRAEERRPGDVAHQEPGVK